VALRQSKSLSALGGDLRLAWREYEQDYARYFANAIVYYALISMVPLVLLLLAALGLFLRLSDLAAETAQNVLEHVEHAFGAPLRDTIAGLLLRLAQESTLASVISLAGLLLAASLLFHHLRITFRAIWGHKPPLASGTLRTALLETLVERAIGFTMVLAGAPLLLALLFVLAIVHWLGGLFRGLPVVGNVVDWVPELMLGVLFVPVMFAALFKVLPPVKMRWRDIRLATALCTIGWLLGAEILTLYFARFGSNLNTYGALGGVLIVMLWMKVVSQMLFFGAELCKVVSRTELPVAPNDVLV
jgi:membrane protein